MEDVKDEVQSDLSKVMKALATDSKGVMVHASTLGALEALLQVLQHIYKTYTKLMQTHILVYTSLYHRIISKYMFILTDRLVI